LSDPATPSRPYDDLFDVQQLAQLEAVPTGGAALVLGMVQADMQWPSARQDRLDLHDHKTRLLSIWLTIIVVLTIAGLSAWVIVDGHGVAGSVLASVDLVALANVFINAWHRDGEKRPHARKGVAGGWSVWRSCSRVALFEVAPQRPSGWAWFRVERASHSWPRWARTP
jgi:hypothetical protein